MEDVVIPTSNPVQTVVAPRPKGHAPSRPPGTVKNFFFMMPFALIILVQAFFLGRLLGTYTTFPIFTIHSYMTIAAIAMLMLVMQVLMRSIIYSTLFGCLLVGGMFHVWFGDFWNPVLQNFREVLTILESAWSKKNVPYPILMAGILTALLGLTAILNFFCSLIVKYFFEIVFGTEWSDGRRQAYLTSIILLLGIHFGFSAWYARQAGAERILWKAPSIYNPLEEYLVRIPSAGMFGPGFVWNYDPAEISVIEQPGGRCLRSRPSGAILPAPTWTRVAQPFVATEKGLTFFDRDLLTETMQCPWPATFPGLPDLTKPAAGDGEAGPPPQVVPILLRPDVSADHILVMFDYGVWGAVSPKSGRFLWARPVDSPTRFNRLFLEEFLLSAYVLRLGDLLCFSCNNGRIAALKADTGDLVWEYNHSEAKYSGKGQRAFLSSGKGYLLAAFPSGSIVALNPAGGGVVHEARSVEWHPTTPAAFADGDVTFLSADGHLIRAELDGGRGKIKFLVAENRLPFMPVPLDLTAGFVAYRDSLFAISSATREVSPILQVPRRIFATNPVIEDPLLYIGTQDGWVICLHSRSYHEKWRVHVGGELAEDALAVTDEGLLVRTRSGSVYLIRKTAQ
ncbi:MAG: hypothetical protein OZSIB_0281 [Candidatus Ozemobacter sibiricus]|uniref:Pyrrolo-quinoline quinone repeat domain-containing protein n=1 Tax=Candidatus Ozemobacter sibiricus TaxID=2268124 RepID=A0A367ZMT5_9BACT|nr:MAG: hypothetical protein OZSIB_0281 [Candidatus Ozemobacter sibiricus]